MREIKLDYYNLMRAIGNARNKTAPFGQFPNVAIPVKLNWPELQLTEDQLLANSIAKAYGREPIFEDNSIVNVTITGVLRDLDIEGP